MSGAFAGGRYLRLMGIATVAYVLSPFAVKLLVPGSSWLTVFMFVPFTLIVAVVIAATVAFLVQRGRVTLIVYALVLAGSTLANLGMAQMITTADALKAQQAEQPAGDSTPAQP